MSIRDIIARERARLIAEVAECDRFLGGEGQIGPASDYGTTREMTGTEFHPEPPTEAAPVLLNAPTKRFHERQAEDAKARDKAIAHAEANAIDAQARLDAMLSSRARVSQVGGNDFKVDSATGSVIRIRKENE